jgi:SpoVK/Ycf46/Vps4 family AAA+-type ATPase
MEAERDAMIKKTEDYAKAEIEFGDDTMLITKSTFEEMCKTLRETCNMMKDICREKEFQSYVSAHKSGDSDIDTSQRLYDSMKYFVVQDILRNYERMGYDYYISQSDGKKSCYFDYKSAEGQLLFAIIMQMLSIDGNEQTEWEELKGQINSQNNICKKIRLSATNGCNAFANADVKAKASNGWDDFALCIILYNYNKEYEKKYRQMMLRIATIIANASGSVTDAENQWLDSIMKTEMAKCEKGNRVEEDHSTIDNPEEELNSMIGLDTVKSEINTLRNFIVMKKKREGEGMKSPTISYHCVFTGNPGTGKTTVARLLAGIYKDLGVLQKGHLVETDRSGLVAEYVGQTAVKTNQIIDKALDGILFIDEAYSLIKGGNEDYGSEAIATLLKRMEDDRDRLVVILAGYTNEMEDFINSNPGLRSRFNRYIHFEDYSAEELYEIFCLQMKKNEYTMTEDNCNLLKKYFVDIVNNKPKDFGNARFVRNLFERAVQNQANRLAKEGNLTRDMLKEIKVEDWNG